MLADDSSSMESEGRFDSLKITLQRVARIATTLQPEGISIRFLNYPGDSDFDNLTTPQEVGSIIDRVSARGPTPLGGMLNQKVVQPLIIKKAVEDRLDKPVIVVIITDGKVRSRR
jgi:hypothetical protein